MPQGRGTEFATLERRTRISRMYVEGKTMQEIANSEGIKVCAVFNHLKKIREFWLSLIAVDAEQIKAEQLAKIDHLEFTAWEAWDRSTQPAEIEHTSIKQGLRVVAPKVKGKAPTAKMVPVEESTEKTIKGQVGDPRFLDIISNCIDKRLKLWGILQESINNNIYIDFTTLLPPKEVKQIDVIEQAIAQVQQQPVESPPQSSGSLPNGLHELGNGQGEDNGKDTSNG